MKFINCIALLAVASGSEDSGASGEGCLNDAWTKAANGECEPKAEHMQLNCNADGITVELAKVLIPDATAVFLQGDCSGTFDDERDLWTLSTKFDTCNTTMKTSNDGFSFSNVARADAFSSSDTIFMSASVFVNFECNYDKFYENIDANGIKIDGDAVDITSVGEGKFEFEITQYADGTFTTAAGPSFVPGFGSDLFFRLSMSNVTQQLEYSIINCTVSDDNLNMSYPIIDHYCADPMVDLDVKIDEDLQTGVDFSYPNFKFVKAANDRGTIMQLTCSAIVCNGNDEESECKVGAKNCLAKKNAGETDGPVNP